MEKMEVRDEIDNYSVSKLDSHTISTPEDIWKFLLGDVDKTKYMSFQIDYDYAYNEHAPGSYTIFGIRDETDEEFTARCNKEAETRKQKRAEAKLMKKQKEEEELALLKKLKEKYEKP